MNNQAIQDITKFLINQGTIQNYYENMKPNSENGDNNYLRYLDTQAAVEKYYRDSGKEIMDIIHTFCATINPFESQNNSFEELVNFLRNVKIENFVVESYTHFEIEFSKKNILEKNDYALVCLSRIDDKIKYAYTYESTEDSYKFEYTYSPKRPNYSPNIGTNVIKFNDEIYELLSGAHWQRIFLDELMPKISENNEKVIKSAKAMMKSTMLTQDGNKLS